MKKYISILNRVKVLLCLFLLTFSVYSCTLIPDMDDICGVWEDGNGGRIEFKSDGTFRAKNINPEKYYGIEIYGDPITPRIRAFKGKWHTKSYFPSEDMFSSYDDVVYLSYENHLDNKIISNTIYLFNQNFYNPFAHPQWIGSFSIFDKEGKENYYDFKKK